jgi:tetratricopeptide (TPR) repeat protein
LERKTNKILVMLLLLFPVLLASAQKRDLAYYQCAFFESYRAGNMAPWAGLIDEMAKVKSADLVWQTEMVKAMYGLVGYEIGAGKKAEAKMLVEKADHTLDLLLKNYPENARLHSLAGAFYGYKISFAFYKAPFLGPKSMYHIDQAIKLDPNEPMGYIEKGNSLQYRPAVFGGDKKEALKFYHKALSLIKARNETKCNWQQMLLRAFILKNLYETDQIAEAEAFLTAMQKDYGSMDWIKKFVGAEFMQGK